MDAILADPVAYFRMREKANERQRRYAARKREGDPQKILFPRMTTFFKREWLEGKEGVGETGGTGKRAKPPTGETPLLGKSRPNPRNPRSPGPAKLRTQKSPLRTMADSTDPPAPAPAPLPTTKKAGRKKKPVPQPVIRILGPRTISFN